MEDFPTLAVPKPTSGEDHEEQDDHAHHLDHHHDHNHDGHEDPHHEAHEEEEDENADSVMDLVQQIQGGSTAVPPEAANEPLVSAEVGEDDELAEDPFYKEDEPAEAEEAGNEAVEAEVKVPAKESRKRKRQAPPPPQDKDKDDEDLPKPAPKKKEKTTENVTGPDCKCKRFKCFQEKTTADDRQVIITVFNNLGDYTKQQAYLAMQIEIGGIAPPKEEVKKRRTTTEAVSSTGQNEGEEGEQEEGEEGEDGEEGDKQPPVTTEEASASTEAAASSTPAKAEATAEGNSLESQNTSVDASLDTSQVDASLDTSQVDASLDASADLSASLVDGMEEDNDNDDNESMAMTRSPTYKKHTYTVKYFVKVNSTKIRVCQKAFCSIFGVSSKRINLLTHKLHRSSSAPITDLRGKHGSRSRSHAQSAVF